MENIRKNPRGPRVPEPYNGIDVNFCKKPACGNYGIPTKPNPPDQYVKGNINEKGIPFNKCKICNTIYPPKSNQGIHEEIERIKGLSTKPKDHTCPNTKCSNYETVSVKSTIGHYSKYGKTKGGGQRYRCNGCQKIFTVSKTTVRQRKSHKNNLFFKLLMNKIPLTRIVEVLDIAPVTIYRKIDYLHERCSEFAYQRERKLFGGMVLPKLYISCDQQDLSINWPRKDVRRNIVFKAAGAADNETGYVFASVLNYDHSFDLIDTAADAFRAGDYTKLPYLRKYARFWLPEFFLEETLKDKKRFLRTDTGDLEEKIRRTYQNSLTRSDIESSENIDEDKQLPTTGMQVHNEYTLYGLFFYLKSMIKNAEKIRFFLDQDSGMRAACLTGFYDEIIARKCDAFYTSVKTKITIDEKKEIVRNSKKAIRRLQKEFPGKSKNEIKLMILLECVAKADEIGPFKNRWVHHPFTTMYEPYKSSSFLTDFNDYDKTHVAWLHNKASKKAIDQFFMNVRRRLSLLERPLTSSANAGRRWYGYDPYRPNIAAKLLVIFRVYYNYCRLGKYDRTPAMRLGLARNKVALEDLIYGRRFSSYSFSRQAAEIKEIDRLRDIEEAKKRKKRREERAIKRLIKKVKDSQSQLLPEASGKSSYVYLDTETTDLGKDKRIVEIAIVDDAGHVLLNTLVNPMVPISYDAKMIHGITNKMVANQPTIEDIQEDIVAAVLDKTVVIYNKKFDIPLLPKPARMAMNQAVCAMDEYAKLKGTKWKKLVVAASEIGYSWEGKAHRALGDTLAFRAIWKYLLTNQVN